MAGLSHVAMAATTAGGSSKGWPGWSPKTPSPPPTEDVAGLSHVATPTATAGGSSGGRALVEAPLRNFLDNNVEIVATRGQPEIWRRFKEAGSLDQESLERKDRAALVVHVTKLEGESVSLFYLNPRLVSAVPCNMDYMQKAWFYNKYGPRAVLQYGDFPVPEMGDNQVLRRVCVVALNPVDLKLRNGVFKDTGLEFPVVPGCDVAGVVVDEAANVSMLSKGDEVYGNI